MTRPSSSWTGPASRRAAGEAAIIPGLDSVQEFTIVSNAVSAKYSRPSEVVISMKSGTNALHGSAFETNRNNAVGLARSRTDNYTKAPYLNRNEYGVNAGGPLIIPKVYNGKDKTFWWFGYEGRQSVSNSTVSFNVPTQAMARRRFQRVQGFARPVAGDLRPAIHRIGGGRL